VVLAARLRTVLIPPLPFYVLRLRRFPFRALGVPNTDGFVGFETPIFGTNNFPYGFDVDPDR